MLLSTHLSVHWGAMMVEKGRSKLRRAAGIALRMLVVVAMTSLLWAWADYSFEAKGPSMNDFTQVGSFIWVVPEPPSWILDGAASHYLGIKLGIKGSYAICFCLFYGGILGFWILQPFKSRWLNFMLPALIFVIAGFCFVCVGLYSVMGPGQFK
jgi:hypothetical protein